LGLLLGKFCLKTATQRSELYEQGFISKSIFGKPKRPLRGPEVDHPRRGQDEWGGNARVHLVAQSGERLIVSREALGKGDQESQLLMDRACRGLAETWAKIWNATWKWSGSRRVPVRS